jgi:hypothetical protein
MFISDPESRIRIFPSRIQGVKDPRSGSVYQRIYSEIESGMFMPDPDFFPSRIPDPGVKKHRIPDPRSGFATLLF